MNDIYKLSREENIFLSKKLLVETIYHTSKFENCNITLPDTQTLLRGVSIEGYKTDDIEVILNLNRAMKLVISNVGNETTLDFICKINYFVAQGESLKWGSLRDSATCSLKEQSSSFVNKLHCGDVKISGVSYIPKIPNEQEIKDKLAILSDEGTKSNTEKALDIFLYLCKAQCFWDGNKRTALLSANHIMINKGVGILIIEEKNLAEFHKLLSSYYENENLKIKEFLYEKCIAGITMEHKLDSNKNIESKPLSLK